MSKLIFYFWKKNKLFFVYLFIVCGLSSQSTWSQSGITIAGNPAGTAGSDLLSLSDPIGFYYDETNYNIIVADNGNVRVMQFSLNNPPSSGTVIAGDGSYGCGLNQFQNLMGVSRDSYGQLYVASGSCGRILKFPPGSTSATNGVTLRGPYQPEGLFTNPLTDDLYVADAAGNAVYKFAINSSSPVAVAGT
jgi:hypothetical protein